MPRQSECEHDIGFYRVIGGEGLDVTEACSQCDTRITSESPKTQFKREQKEKIDKAKARKERKEEKKEARETKDDEKLYTKETKKDKDDGDIESIKFTEKEPKKKGFWL